MGPRVLQRRMENALNDDDRKLAAELFVEFDVGVNPTGGKWPLTKFSDQELSDAQHRVQLRDSVSSRASEGSMPRVTNS